METPEENKQVPVKKDSQELLPSTSQLTMQVVINNFARVKMVFPSLAEGFYAILLERIEYYKFSDVEFIKTVNHIFDTSKYPPQISDFISYMRPDGISDIPNREEEKPKGYHDINWADVPKKEDMDLSFLDEPKDESPEDFK